ncbi:MAG TPA: hypothetical protein VKS21_08980, partial [Spirochaetota bacterium]|nr:hypothetical protein [Spirochaetota bacterium]
MPLKRILITVLVLLISFNCKSEGDDPREKIAVLHNDISPRDEAIQIIEESRSLNDPLEKQVTDKSSVPVTDPDTVNEMEGSVMATGSNVPDEIPMTEPKGTLTPAEIKNLIHKGRFSKILSYEINTASPLAKYYYGITYYCLAKAYPAGDGKRSSYASKAISILKEAAVDTDSRRLKAKAVLWHGIA